MGLRITPSSHELYHCNELSLFEGLSFHCTSPSGKYGHADQTDSPQRIDFYGADGTLAAYSIRALFLTDQMVYDASSDKLIGTIRSTNNLLPRMLWGDTYDFFDPADKKIASVHSDFWLHHYTFYNPHTEEILATSEVPWFSNTYTIKILQPGTIDPRMIVFMHIKNSIIRADDNR